MKPIFDEVSSIHILVQRFKKETGRNGNRLVSMESIRRTLGQHKTKELLPRLKAWFGEENQFPPSLRSSVGKGGSFKASSISDIYSQSG